MPLCRDKEKGGKVVVAAVLFLGACGGDVVAQPSGQSASTSGQGGASNTESSARGTTGAAGGAGAKGGASGSDRASSASGSVDPCLGQPCGTRCAFCAGDECWQGFCNAAATCEMPTQICGRFDPEDTCPSKEGFAAGMCVACGGGEDCMFAGCVLSDPHIGVAGCCAHIVGGCVAKP